MPFPWTTLRTLKEAAADLDGFGFGAFHPVINGKVKKVSLYPFINADVQAERLAMIARSKKNGPAQPQHNPWKGKPAFNFPSRLTIQFA
jgi:hypothetical protein